MTKYDHCCCLCQMYCWLRIRHFWLMRHCRSYPAKWNRFLWWKTVAKWSKNRTTLKIAFPENIRCNQALFLLLPMSNGLLTSHQIFLANQALKNIAEVTPAKWNRFLWWKAIAKWSKNGTALKVLLWEYPLLPSIILAVAYVKWIADFASGIFDQWSIEEHCRNRHTKQIKIGQL